MKKRYSLFILFLVIFIFLAGAFEIQLYLNAMIQKNNLIQENVDADMQTLNFLNRTIFSPNVNLQSAGQILTQEFLNQAAKLPNIFSIEVTDASGTSIITSGTSSASIGLDRVKILSQLKGKKAFYIQGITIYGKSAQLLVHRGQFGKIFWLIFSQEKINQNIRRLFLVNSVIGVAWLLILSVIFLIILNIILKPIEELRVLFNKVRGGDLNIKAKAKSRTEIGELAETFNQMVEDLKKSKESLEEAKTTLEIQIQARTKELKDLVDGLEAEVQRRTKEVYERMRELERFKDLAVARELKMIELKKNLRILKGEPPKEEGPRQTNEPGA